MKELFKKTFDHPYWSHVLNFLGVMAILDWIVFPALTAPSTIFNISGMFVGIGLIAYTLIYVKENFFKLK